MTLDKLKAKYDGMIAKAEQSIEWYKKRDKGGQFAKVIEFYKGRLWLLERFRKDLEEMET